jgi:hypothetical protein
MRSTDKMSLKIRHTSQRGDPFFREFFRRSCISNFSSGLVYLQIWPSREHFYDHCVTQGAVFVPSFYAFRPIKIFNLNHRQPQEIASPLTHFCFRKKIKQWLFIDVKVSVIFWENAFSSTCCIDSYSFEVTFI